MNHRTLNPLRVAVAMASAALVLSACGDPAPRAITEVREADAPRKAVPPNAPDWVRFRLPAPGASHSPHGGPGDSAHASGGEATLTWDLPEGWTHEPTKTRPYNFRVGGASPIDCYLTAMPKMQATVAMNINRWRKQMGVGSIPDAAIEALPRKPMFGQKAYFLDVEGAYGGMGGQQPKPDWRMLGLIFETPTEFVFLKMVGPEAGVATQRGAFLSLAASLGRKAPVRPGPGAIPDRPPAGRGLTWTAPAGWKDIGASGIREVTFEVQGPKTTCWVLFLSGDGGGVEMNVNRWLREVGQDALSAEQVAELPRLSVLGQPSVLVEGSGDYRGMGGPATSGAGLLGLICPLSGRSLFVKMVGPAVEVAAQRENFKRLCESLSLTQ